MKAAKKSNVVGMSPKISKRGGVRPGAGRKPGSGNKPTNNHLYEPCANALAVAMDGAIPLEFICAMGALGAPLDAAREALGLSQEEFAKKYGKAISAIADRWRAGARPVNAARVR